MVVDKRQENVLNSSRSLTSKHTYLGAERILRKETIATIYDFPSLLKSWFELNVTVSGANPTMERSEKDLLR